MKQILRTFPIICMMCAAWSCGGEDDPGVIPPGDLGPLNAIFSDSTTVQVSVHRDQTLRTDVSELASLGSCYDPVFGPGTGSFYSTVDFPTPITTFGSNTSLDSVVLVLSFKDAYGDISKLTGHQTLEVFEVTQDIPDPSTIDGGFNSSTSFSLATIPLATMGFVPQFPTYKNQGKQLRIKLSSSVGQRVLDAGSLNTTIVRQIFKGFHVRIKPTSINQSPGEGAIVFFDLASANSQSGIHIYFRSDLFPGQPVVHLKTSGNLNFRHNVFSHDYSLGNAEFATMLADTTDTTIKKMFIQPMEGVRMKLKLPFLKSYENSGKIIIHKAELVLPVDESADLTTFPQPSQLIVYYLNEEGKIRFLDDATLSFFGGTYDATKKEYRFIITLHVNKILRGLLKNEFYLDVLTTRKNSMAHRAVLLGPGNSTKPMKLNLIYTKAN